MVQQVSSKSAVFCLALGVILALIANVLYSFHNLSIFGLGHGKSEIFLSVFFTSFVFSMIISHNGKRYFVLSIGSGLLALLLAWIASSALQYGSPTTYTSYAMLLYAQYAMFCLLQSYHQSDYKKPRYELLFANAWNNISLIFSSLVFVLLVALMLEILKVLTQFIGISFLLDIINSGHFWLSVIPFAACVGFYFSYKWGKVIYSTRMVLLEFLKVLLPVFSVIGWLFVVAMFVKAAIGSDLPFDEYPDARFICNTFCMAGLVFINAVYQDGTAVDKLSLFSRRLVTSMVVLLPLMLVVGVYFEFFKDPYFTLFSRRVASVEIRDSIIVTLLLLLYAGAYLHAIFKKSERWFVGIERANFILAWVLIAVALFMSAPLPFNLSM